MNTKLEDNVLRREEFAEALEKSRIHVGMPPASLDDITSNAGVILYNGTNRWVGAYDIPTHRINAEKREDLELFAELVALDYVLSIPGVEEGIANLSCVIVGGDYNTIMDVPGGEPVFIPHRYSINLWGAMKKAGLFPEVHKSSRDDKTLSLPKRLEVGEDMKLRVYFANRKRPSYTTELWVPE